MVQVTEQIITGPVFSGKFTMCVTPIIDADYGSVSTDQVIIYTSLTASRTVTLTPLGNSQNYKYWQIKDNSGNCSSTKAINLTSTSGTFDGLVSTAISSPGGSKTFYDDGTNFFMVGAFLPSVNLSTKIQKADGNGGLLDAVSGTDYAAPGSAATRTVSALSLSLVGTGATGTQISSTKDSTVRCTISTSTTSTIGGPSTSVVVMKICSTNNATEGSWTTVATFESDQTITLAVALQSIQIVKGQLSTDVPAGWFVKLVNSGTGTHTETFVSGQQTIYG